MLNGLFNMINQRWLGLLLTWVMEISYLFEGKVFCRYLSSKYEMVIKKESALVPKLQKFKINWIVTCSPMFSLSSSNLWDELDVAAELDLAEELDDSSLLLLVPSA